jgi:hypothetical protein
MHTKPARIPLVVLALCIILAVTGLASAGLLDKSKNQTIRHNRAEARISGITSVLTGPERKDFRFGDMTAWLNSDGDFLVKGKVRHSGLQCATYEVGIRFGAGDPGCTNVHWLMDTDYVTQIQQCNNSTVQHTGGESGYFIKNDYKQVSCAERFIRCRGNCN